MGPVEWIGMATGIVGTLTGGTALGRLLVTHGADRERVKACEAWIKGSGVERGDFHNLRRRVDDAEKDCLPRREFDALTDRVDKVEGEMSELSKLLGEIRVEIGKIPGQIASQKELFGLQFENVNHRINGVKQVLENWHRLPNHPE